MQIKYKLLEGGVSPYKGSKDAAGMDLALPVDVSLMPGEIKTVSLQICFEVQYTQYYILLVPRSSLLPKYHIMMPVSVIDWDYRGPVHAIMHNCSNETIVLQENTRVAQVLVVENPFVFYTGVQELETTDRGDRGIGSTGA